MTRRRNLDPIFYFLLIFAAAIYLLPIYMLLITGFKSFAE